LQYKEKFIVRWATLIGISYTVGAVMDGLSSRPIFTVERTLGTLIGGTIVLLVVEIVQRSIRSSERHGNSDE